jgi:hypothetical protein
MQAFLKTGRLAFSGVAFLTFVASLAAAEVGTGLDWRHKIASPDFSRTGNGEWTSPSIKPPFAFDELIYSWDLQKPGDSFRLYLQAEFSPSDRTEWLPAGFWGQVVDGITNRQRPTFDRGILDMDWLRLKSKATAFKFKVVSAGKTPLANPPGLTIVASDSKGAALKNSTLPPSPRIMDVPLRRQMDSRGERMRDRCQSAALASAMEYFGKSIPLEDIVRFTHDPEYDYPGLWPRVTAAAQEFGHKAYVDRFRNWDDVKRTIAENKVILCSMRMAKGVCKAPPYASMGPHIVALCGMTDDGRVVVTDSALGKSGTGYLCQWLQSDFETVWMQTKGGVAMVICPSEDARPKLVANLPPFPKDRLFPAADDH